ncbi:BTAD domain-containing putative transcriptional regulator [Streptomyces sp. NPDC020719]|uniref:AfsR/SARP family transcriptional regulator n=1 Tax=Streptomyces sp. NPDC020719 TaxID=3154896 RepID=UPI0033D4ADEF
MPGTGEGGLRFRLLGAFEGELGGQLLPLGPPQQRALLAVLLLRESRPVSMPELLDAMWGERLPQRAVGTLRTYVSRLRALLEPGRPARSTATVLMSADDGYVLRLPRGALDTAEFERRIAGAGRLRTGGDALGAHRELEAALTLWAGTPLAGLPGPHAERQRDRLTELWLTAREEHFHCALALDRQAEIVAPLRAFAAEHPLRERAQALLMLALHREGRQAEALGVFEATRRTLQRELGATPGPELSALHTRLLGPAKRLPAAVTPKPVAASAVSVRTGSATPGTAAPAVLRRVAQLPPDVTDFVGRREAVAALCGLLKRAAEGQSAEVGVIGGVVGSGKTALAVHVGHAVRDAFTGGQLYLDLRGSTADPIDAVAALGHMLRSLGITEQAVPEGAERRAALYRSLLAGQRVLVVLDDVRDMAQVSPLLPERPGCAVLITSRSHTLTPPGARHVNVAGLAEEEASALLGAVAGADRVGREPEAARELTALCDGLPLAVRIAASHLAARPDLPLADAVRQHVDGTGVEAVLQRCYEALDPVAARAFRLMSTVEVPVFAPDTVAALLAVAEPQAVQALRTLAEAGLLETHDRQTHDRESHDWTTRNRDARDLASHHLASHDGPHGMDRYSFPRPFRAFARHRLDGSPDAAERPAALRRLVEHTLAGVRNAIARTRPLSVVPELLYAPEQSGAWPTDADRAMAWLREAHPLIRAVVEQAVRESAEEQMPIRPVVDLLTGWTHLALGTAHCRELADPARLTLAAAHRRGDQPAAGRALRVLAAVPPTGPHGFARTARMLRQALRHAEACGDRLSQAAATFELGLALGVLGRPNEALPLYAEARERFAALGARTEEARALASIARVRMVLGETEKAEETIDEALCLARELADPIALGHVLYHVGCALLSAGRPARAAAHLRESRQHHQRTGSPRWEALAWARLAYCALDGDRPGEAAACATQALSLEGPVGDPYCRGLALAARSRALLALGEVPALSALDSLRTANRMLRACGAAEADEVAGAPPARTPPTRTRVEPVARSATRYAGALSAAPGQ